MRKRYPSDKTTTTLRISKAVHSSIRKAAKKDGRTVSAFVDRLLTTALSVPAQKI